MLIGGDDPMDVSELAPETLSMAMDTSGAQPSQQPSQPKFGSFNGAVFSSPSMKSPSSAPPRSMSSVFPTSDQHTANGSSNGTSNPTPPGFSPFDPATDIDWQNWDQLVRQFGLEDNATTLDPSAGQPVNWAGSWGNMNNGMGSDWF